MPAPVRKCVVPVAGFGTRFLPATKAVPKEMLPIVDKPALQYVVEEAADAGCGEITIVSGRLKRAIEDHFDTSFELERLLEDAGKTEELELVRSIGHIAKFAYVRQPLPLGDGDALLHARPTVGDEPFLVLFGDDIIRGERSAAERLLAAFARLGAPVIATMPIADAETRKYGVVEGAPEAGGEIRVTKFLEKPAASETASRVGVIGKYVLTPEVFPYLEKARALRGTGETRLADAFALMVADGRPVYALPISGKRYDTGSKIGFLKATVDFALERADLGPELRAYLEEVVGK